MVVRESQIETPAGFNIAHFAMDGDRMPRPRVPVDRRPSSRRKPRRLAWMVAAWMLAGALVSSAQAGSPWQKMALFKRLEADPDNDYPLTESQGPWMIMAVTFMGDQAPRQAKELVYELRSVYKLPAYTYTVRFDHGKDLVGRGIDRYGAPLKMKYQRPEVQEIAVLVGDYPTADDPEGQKTLKRLKYLMPDCMDVEKLNREGRATSAPLAGWRWVVENTVNADKEKRRGPLGHSFVSRNPLLPDEYFRPKGLEKIVYDMNKDLKHSLLTCPGKYSVKVATFTGSLVTDQNEIKAIEAGKKMQSKLDEAANKAHELTEALRAKGYPAYEFHDRHSSIVTVGSFDSVGTPRADGKIEINPEIHKIMQTFGAQKGNIGDAAWTVDPNAVGQPKVVAKIPLDVQPVPVEVPQRNVVAEYNRTVFNR
jgi:hypothetical protein